MDAKINAQALNSAFPGNTLGIFDTPDANVPDAFVPIAVRPWVQAAVAHHAARLPPPPVPRATAPQLLEFAHFANLGAQVEREALDAIELTTDQVLNHVNEALRFAPESLRWTQMARRAGSFIVCHAGAFLAHPSWRALDPQAAEAQFIRAALAATLLAATQRHDFSAADDPQKATALTEILLPHLTREQRQSLAPWLLRAGGAASQAVLDEVRASFAQLQASCGNEKPPLLAAAARKLQTWYFGAAAKAWAPGLPSSERLRVQAQTAPLGDAAGARPRTLGSTAAAAAIDTDTDTDDIELLRAVNARTPLTADDWWQVLHERTQVQPCMLRTIAERVQVAPPNVAAAPSWLEPCPVLRAGAALRAYLQAVHPLSFVALEPVGAAGLNALADASPGLTELSLLCTLEDEAQTLVRFTRLRALYLRTPSRLDLRTSVAPLTTLEKLVVHTSQREPHDWSALADLPKLTSLQIVGRLSQDSLRELYDAGLGPVLDLHATTLSRHL